MPSSKLAPIVRIRRRVMKHNYCHGKRIYRYDQLELTIPAKFKDLVEPFVGRDLKVEAKLEGGGLIIEARPIE